MSRPRSSSTAFAADDRTRVIAVYCEDFRDGRAFARAGEGALAAGKQVVLLAAGASPAGARAAASHTGALASDSAAVDAACRAAGIQRVATPKELVDTALACLGTHRPRGRRIAVVGDGGGTGVVTADLATAAGLELPELSDALAAKLTAIAPTVISANPVDLAGAGEQDFRNFERVTSAVLESGEVDAVVFTGYFGGYSQMNEEFSARETEVAHAIAASAHASGRPLVAQAMFWQSPPARALREDGIPVYRDIEAAVGTLARLVDQELHARPGVPVTGAPEPPVAGDGYFDARELLSSGGIHFTSALRAATPAEAREAAAALGYPVALKALGLLHKSDAGGVALGLAGVEELDAALADMEARLRPPGYSVEAMADTSHGVELIVGCMRDPRFGPIVLVGLGGIHAELLRDVVVALAPAGADEMEALILSLRGAGLLTGARGRPLLDVRRPPRPPRPSHASPRRIPRSPRSRSTRCSSHRPARSASTPASSWPDGRAPTDLDVGGVGRRRRNAAYALLARSRLLAGQPLRCLPERCGGRLLFIRGHQRDVGVEV